MPLVVCALTHRWVACAQAVATLSLQYRMNEDVQAVSNLLVYDGALHCGNPAVAAARLRLPRLAAAPVPSYPGGMGSDASSTAARDARHWLLRVMDAERSVVFANTDTLAPGVTLETRLASPASGGGGDAQGQAGARQSGQGAVRGVAKRPSKRRGVCNETEAVLVATAARALVACGCPPRDIGVISPYRAQLDVLRRLLTGEDVDDVEVDTVDR